MKILIITPSFKIGGTTVSLEAFLRNVNPQSLEIDVYARSADGPMRQRLVNCNILSENIWLARRICKKNIVYKILNFLLNTLRFLAKQCKIDLIPIYAYIGGRSIGSNKYDVVISYQEALSNWLAHIPAKKRVAWIRAEYPRYLSLCGFPDETKIYNRIDKIISVSNFSTKSFTDHFPQFAFKSQTIFNCMCVEDIRRLAKGTIPFDPEFNPQGITLLSGGRLDVVKQFEKIPSIAKELKNLTEKPFKWFIIGSGSSDIKEAIELQINNNNVQNEVILLPQTTNLYQYMARADLFVHTSSSETFSRVVSESLSVGTPVVINNYGCAKEFVQEGRNGYVVELVDMPKLIADLLNNDQLSQLKSNLSDYSYDNYAIIKETINMLNSL